MNQKDEIKKVIDRIDQSQLSNESTESSDYEAITRDPPFPEYGKTDPVADGNRPYANADPIIPNSMKRFCIDHTNEISESDLRANKKMVLNQSVDDTAKGGQ